MILMRFKSLTFSTMAFTPILSLISAYPTGKVGWEFAGMVDFVAYLRVLRVANPLSTGSGVPEPPGWVSPTAIVLAGKPLGF
jgi:hypothetical protein